MPPRTTFPCSRTRMFHTRLHLISSSVLIYSEVYGWSRRQLTCQSSMEARWSTDENLPTASRDSNWEKPESEVVRQFLCTKCTLNHPDHLESHQRRQPPLCRPNRTSLPARTLAHQSKSLAYLGLPRARGRRCLSRSYVVQCHQR